VTARYLLDTNIISDFLPNPQGPAAAEIAEFSFELMMLSSDSQIYEIWRHPVLRIAVAAGRLWRADRKSLRASDPSPCRRCASIALSSMSSSFMSSMITLRSSASGMAAKTG